MAANFGNAEASGRPAAPGGFNPRPSPQLAGFVEFGEATFRAGATETERPRHEAGLLGSLVYRPMVFRRNDIGWIAACAWRSATKVDDLAALKRAKREIDQRLIREAGELTAALIRQLRGEPAADAITCVLCGHSRRPDCFGKWLAQCVAELLRLPFHQVFADRFCEGVSHGKEFKKLPPLQQIADPLASMIVVDDLSVSGWHVEELLLHPSAGWRRSVGVRADFGVGGVRIGIVGSHRRTEREAVEACVGKLAAETIVITGGARGADRWAEEAARSRGLAVVVYMLGARTTEGYAHF